MAKQQPLKLTFLSKEQVSQTASANRVPVYRIKNNKRSLMGWAMRDNRLRAAIEIRIVDDVVEVVRSKSDA